MSQYNENKDLFDLKSALLRIIHKFILSHS